MVAMRFAKILRFTELLAPDSWARVSFTFGRGGASIQEHKGQKDEPTYLCDYSEAY
jgi:hypothetical protein